MKNGKNNNKYLWILLSIFLSLSLSLSLSRYFFSFSTNFGNFVEIVKLLAFEQKNKKIWRM